MKPRALILRTAGTNCDGETAYAFELAGAIAEKLHVNRLLENPEQLAQYQFLAIPGGFSYGDDIAAGRIFANQIRHHLAEVLRRFVEAGKPIIGICNGFQVLVKTDLLPGPMNCVAATQGDTQATGQTCTLAHNTSGRFIDHWIRLAPQGGKCIWTKGLGPMELPIAHGEGRFVPGSPAIRQALWADSQVALVYATAEGNAALGDSNDNPNGSTDAIAGICDRTGLILGLMPHPERFVNPQQHPAWSSRLRVSEGQGLAFFRNAVSHVTAGAVAI